MMFTTLVALLSIAGPGVLASVPGVATFNDYTTQSGVACGQFGFGPQNDQGNGIFSAALGDLSPLWTGPKCSGNVNGALW